MDLTELCVAIDTSKNRYFCP